MSHPPDELTSWHGPWAGHSALVVGLGATGFAVLDTLSELGVEVTAVAAAADEDVTRIVSVLGQRAIVAVDPAVRDRAARESGADFVVVSPGVALDDPAIVAARDAGWPVWSDVDFAWRVRDKFSSPAEWIVVGGERYARATIDLAQRIVNADQRRAGVCGYGFPPVLDLVRDPVEYEFLLLHAPPTASRWWASQPEATREPLVSVSVEGEGAPDLRVIYEGTRLACIYWKDAGPTESWVEAADVVEGARAIGLGLGSPGMSELGIVESIVVDRAFLEDRKNQALEVSTLEELAEAGWELPADMPSLLAATAIARALDVSPALIAGVISLP